jgi:ElaB/YqjD/DUF883 family membrane-anchored ribosome-binding protein
MGEELQELSDMNSELTLKIAELEKKVQSEATVAEKNIAKVGRETRIEVLKETEDRLRSSIKRFTESVRNMKMEPLVYLKIEEFLLELRNVQCAAVSKPVHGKDRPISQKIWNGSGNK